MINTYLASLVHYGLRTGLIEPCDKTYITNMLLQVMELDAYEEAPAQDLPLEKILNGLLENAILHDLPLTGELEKHAPWVAEMKGKYTFTAENITDILRTEVGLIFSKVLEHAGVYKRTTEGRKAFLRFVEAVR